MRITTVLPMCRSPVAALAVEPQQAPYRNDGSGLHQKWSKLPDIGHKLPFNGWMRSMSRGGWNPMFAFDAVAVARPAAATPARDPGAAATARPVALTTMTSDVAAAGFRPPQQARSRAALQKLLTAAEEVLVSQGLAGFTIAAVAEHAGVSVGGVYRRFAGKEQLLDAVLDALLMRVLDTVAASLKNAEPSLFGVVSAFADALATSFMQNGQVASILASAERTPEAQQRGAHVRTAVQRLFLDAAAPYGHQIARSAQSTALTTVLRTIVATAAHRAAVIQWWPDGMSWAEWAREITDMATAYLTTPDGRLAAGELPPT